MYQHQAREGEAVSHRGIWLNGSEVHSLGRTEEEDRLEGRGATLLPMPERETRLRQINKECCDNRSAPNRAQAGLLPYSVGRN